MLKVKTKRWGDVSVLRVSGRLITGATETLREAVLAQTDSCAVVLDLEGVDIIDAKGLGLLLELREWCHSNGKKFRLMNVNRLVHRVLELTRLNTVFDITSKSRVRRRNGRSRSFNGLVPSQEGDVASNKKSPQTI
jgi:anti-anti-sigma factor